jgi:hypothetical protein
MPQGTLLSNITANTVGKSVKLFSPDTVMLQFTPRIDGFSASILIETASMADVNPGHLWYSIPTIGMYPWFDAAELVFSSHSKPVAFTLRLTSGNLWIRATVSKYTRGAVSAYLAQ